LSLSVPGVDQVVDMLDGPALDVSSTAIRHWLSRGRSPRFLIPGKVLDYIQEQGLYQDN
jgi:nicotinate-nucleotide adenylyltransferase